MQPLSSGDPAARRAPKKRGTRKKHKKNPLGGVAVSCGAVLITLFSLGKFPSVNQWFSDANTSLQSHNDELVSALLSAGPVLLIALAVAGLAAMVLSSVNESRRKRAL